MFAVRRGDGVPRGVPGGVVVRLVVRLVDPRPRDPRLVFRFGALSESIGGVREASRGSTF